MKRADAKGADAGPPKSQIAPSEAKNENRNASLLPGVDLVILLDADNDVCIQRAVGRKFDPLTEQIYHIQQNPPTLKVPGKK